MRAAPTGSPVVSACCSGATCRLSRFWVLAFSYGLLALVALENEQRVYVFVVRLMAFLLIILVMVDHPGAKGDR